MINSITFAVSVSQYHFRTFSSRALSLSFWPKIWIVSAGCLSIPFGRIWPNSASSARNPVWTMEYYPLSSLPSTHVVSTLVSLPSSFASHPRLPPASLLHCRLLVALAVPLLSHRLLYSRLIKFRSAARCFPSVKFRYNLKFFGSKALSKRFAFIGHIA